MRETDPLRALLDWYAAIGVDEAIDTVARDRMLGPPPLARMPARDAGGEADAPAPRDPAPGRAPPASPPSSPRPFAPPGERAGGGRAGGAGASSGRVAPEALRAQASSPAVQDAVDLAAAAGDLDALRLAVAAFEGCALKRTATNLVFGDGNPAARVMLVGEAPGADEDRLGKPFVGVSGQLLDRMLATIGLDRMSAYITNILPWRPPGNRKPTAAEIAACLPFVRRQVDLVAPAVLVCVGGTAASALLDRGEGIMRLRGRWYTLPGDQGNETVQVTAIFHPAFLLRSPGQKRDAWRDLLAIRQKMHSIG